MNSVKSVLIILALVTASQAEGRKFEISKESFKGNSAPEFNFTSAENDQLEKFYTPVDTDPEKFKFFLYNDPSNTSQYEELNYMNGSVEISSFIRGVPLIVLNHGFLSGHNSSDHSTFPQNVKNAYLRESSGTIQRNILITDWSSLSTPKSYYPGSYTTAATNVQIVGKRLAQILGYFIWQDYVKSSDIHIVGHSLGAHVSGSTGRFLLNQTGEKIGRITGHMSHVYRLDPAGPLFYTGVAATPMSKDDAKFVDVIHTSTGIFGKATHIGHVDFYPYFGALGEKDCKKLVFTVSDQICIHSYAHMAFAKSINKDYSVRACKCDGTSNFFSNCPTAPDCNGKGSAIFGEHVEFNTTEGEYFFDASKYLNPL